MATKIITQTIDDKELPANYRMEKTSLVLPSSNFHDFLREDLSVKRIDSIGKHLWVVGRRYPPRPLNLQAVLRREIIPTTDVNLHLVWTTGKIFIKPLPRYLVSDDFYKQYLSPVTSQEVEKNALGLLYSYVAMLPTEFDFMLASKDENNLMPPDYNWERWRLLSQRLLTDYPNESIREHLPLRYQYGELRLSRLKKIYQFMYGELQYGFHRDTGSTRYVDFFIENIASIATAIVYITLVLTAMQVGLASQALGNNAGFQRACYGFTVFSIVGPLLAFVPVYRQLDQG